MGAHLTYAVSMSDSYSLLDFGSGHRLEQWGQYRLIRPDPTAVLPPAHPEMWKVADATYVGEKGKGEWQCTKPLPEHWSVAFDDLLLHARLAPYKHTGVFPEQQQNWRWAREHSPQELAVLNLFAYTGGASVALAKDGHSVTHVDAAKPSIGWAKENALLNAIGSDQPDNGLAGRIRWILDDAAVFAGREVRREKKYDAIIIDPPAFGHSPSGKTWRVERDLAPLLETCAMLLSDSPAFIVLNGYAQNDTAESFRRLLTGILRTKAPKRNFTIESQELLLTAEDGRTLSTGIVSRVLF